MNIFGNFNNQQSVFTPMQGIQYTSTDQTDVRYHHKNIAQEFCKQYYTQYDSNFANLSGFYRQDSIFTFLEEEYMGYQNLYNRMISHYGLQKLTHQIKTIDSQPLGAKTLLITVTGLIRANDHTMPNSQFSHFVETMVLQKDDQQNTFFVISTIFRVIPQ